MVSPLVRAFGSPPVATHPPNVAAIDIVLIRRVEDALSIAAQRDLLHIEIAWGEQLRRASIGTNRVEMISPVFLRDEDDSAVVGKFERLKGEQGQRILHGVAAAKQFMAFTRLRVCDTERPRPRELWN